MRRKSVSWFVLALVVSMWTLMFEVSLPIAKETKPRTLSSDMPVVFVDPQRVLASPGETFTIAVKVFNLTDNYYSTDQQWKVGEALGSPGARYNYSLGNLYGFDVMFSWDPTLLDYVSHSVKVPVDAHPGGILHEPTIDVMDVIDTDAGTYWVAQASQYPALIFNIPDGNATLFTMTFRVIREGVCTLSLDSVDLAVFFRPQGDYMHCIPHWARDGRARITKRSCVPPTRPAMRFRFNPAPL